MGGQEARQAMAETGCMRYSHREIPSFLSCVQTFKTVRQLQLNAVSIASNRDCKHELDPAVMQALAVTGLKASNLYGRG